MLSLVAGYVLPLAAEFRIPQQTQPVALESLHVSQFAFPALRVPAPVRASAQPALPTAPVPTRAATRPQRQAQRAAVPARRVRVPVVSNDYVLVPQPKPATKDDTSAPVYEESIGAMPDVMIDPATPDPVAQATAQAAEQERIARLEAEAQARAEAAAAAAQAQAQVEAAAAAPAPTVTVTVAAPADTNANTVSTTVPATDAGATQTATATTTDDETISAGGTSGGSETIAPQSGAAVTSPASNEIATGAAAPAQPVVSQTQIPDPDPPAATLNSPATGPISIPSVNQGGAALPLDPVANVTPPIVTTTVIGTSNNGAAAGPATGAETPTATAGGGGTSAAGSPGTATSGGPAAAQGTDGSTTAPGETITAGQSDPPATARGPPAGATEISAADGGSVVSADGGATVSFAPGVLLNDIYVTVTPSKVSAPAEVTTASPAYDLVATNANGDVVERFGGAAELTIDYTSAMPPRIYYLHPTDGAIELDSVVDPATHTVRAPLVHFSTYVAATPVDELANRPPVAGVTVAVTVLAPGGTAIADALVQGTSDTGYEVRGHTDAAGTISLGVSRGMWTFSVSGVSNLQSAAQALDTTTGSSLYALAFGLNEFPVYVTGTVRDASGNPLAGVRVEARSESGAVRAEDFALSGVDGSYRLGGLLGQWSVNGQDLTDYYPRSLESRYTPSASHSASLVVTGVTTQDLRYTLMPRTLSGNLKDQNGNGVAGASVYLEVYSHTFDYHFSATVITAGDGSYAARLPADVFRVDIRAKLQPAGYADLDVESTTWNAPSLDAGDAIVIADFHYYRFSTSASGVVRGDPGGAVAGYTVAAEFYSALRARWFWIEATTDANGAWTISGDPAVWNIYPGTSIVGHSAAALRGVAVGAGGLTNVELLLIAGASVAGTVAFQNTGAAVAGVGIQVCGLSCAATRTNSLGEYVAWLAVDPETRSSDATVRMLTGRIGYGRSTASITGAAAGGRLVRDLLYVPFSTPYSGTVLDSFGTPVAGAVIHLSDGLDEALVAPQADGTWAGLGPAVEARVSATGVFPTSGNSAILLASAGAIGVVLLLPATRLAGTVTDDLGAALAGVTVNAERWLCAFGAAHCDWADLFGSFYGQRISTVASTASDSAGNYEFTLDPALFSDNFPLRLAPQRVAGHLTPGLLTPTYLPGRITDADVVYRRATIEIQGVANGGVYGRAVTPVIVTTPVFDAVEVTLNGASWTPGELSAGGAYTIVARALRSGAEVARAAVTFAIDTIAPVVTVAGVANGGAYPAAVTPDIAATDPNLAFTTITLDGSPFAGGAVSNEGRHVLVVSASDWAANAASTTIVFWVDATAPTTALTTNPVAGPFNDLSVFTLDASDDGSGVQATYWLLDGGPATSAPLSLGGLRGPHILSWYSIDRAGNTEASQSATLVFSRPLVSVGDVSVAEGNSGATTATFVFTLSESAPADVTITYALAGGTATAGVDFVEGTGTATITAGATATSVDVTINGDAALEPDETFTLTITAAAGAEVARGTATGTILNDDVAEVVPAAPSSPDLLDSDDHGSRNNDDLTNVTRPRFGVTTAPGLLVELVEAGTVLGAAIANDLGVAIVQVDLALTDGLHTIAARARVNALSTPGALSTALSVRIDTVAPTAPVLDLSPAEDTGLSNTDNVTNFAIWHIYASPGDGNLVVTTEVAPNGRVTTFDAAPDRLFVFLPDPGGGLGPDKLQGMWTYTAQGVDDAGNVSALSNVLAIVYDSIAPAAPIVALPDVNAADRSSVQLTVTGETGAAVSTNVSDGVARVSGAGVVGEGGVFSTLLDLSGLADGVLLARATLTDLAGNTSAVGVDSSVKDTLAPAAPGVALADVGLANRHAVLLEVVGEVGAAVAYVIGDGTASVAGSGSIGAGGVFSTVLDLSGLADGVLSASATLRDAFGNVSAAGVDSSLKDTVAPAGTIVINRGDAVTSSTAAVLALAFVDAVGAADMRFSTDNGTTWSDWQAYASELRLTLPGPDGVKTVLVEVRDRVGNVGSARDDILLDRKGPAITITGPVAGVVLDVVQIAAVIFTAIDPSGIGSTSITVDGRPLSGSSIDAFLLGPRSHTLVVTVVDTVGNVSTATITFEVHASLDGLTQAIRRAAAAGLIEAGEALNLLSELDRAARDVARGDVRGAARRISNVGLELFREAGGRVDLAFGGRAAGWAFDLAERLSAGSTLMAVAKTKRGHRHDRK
ncbi:MAG TPA: Ig-like domain-containing protein [Gaiellaceae bacterium]|nr:Ig-like domain-containing protein [Gaiellaceae bacterium]